MHILSVELENIKRYVHDRFEFMLGTNAISGPNGAGKSTILEGIGFTLFDSLPYKKEDFLKRGASVGTVRVTFESSVDEREYTVVRNTRSTYYVYDPETKTRLAEQKTDVLSWLREHLGVEPDTDLDEFFRTTIGVPQGTFTSIFLDTATRRKAVFDRILRVEEYRQSSDALKETANHFQAMITEADKALASYQGRLLRMPDLEVQQQQLDNELLSTEARHERSSKELAGWQVRLVEMEALEKAIAKDKQDLDALETKRAYVKKELAASEERVQEAERAAAELKGLEATFRAYQEAESELTRLQADLKSRDALRSERAVLQRKQDEATFTVQALNTQLAALSRDAEERETLRPKLEAQLGYEQRIEAFKAQLAEAKAVEERLKRTSSELATWQERLKALDVELAEMDKLCEAPKRVSMLEASLKEQQETLTKLQEADLKRKELENRRKLLDEAVAKDRKAIADHERTLAEKAPLKALAEELDALTEQGQTLRDRLSAVAAVLERDRQAMSQFKAGNLCPILNVGCPILEGQSAENYFQSAIASNEQKVKALNASIFDLRKRWKEASEAGKQLAALEGVRSQLAAAKKTLAEHEPELTTLTEQLSQPSYEAERRTLEQAMAEGRLELAKAQSEAAKFEQRERLFSQRSAFAKEQSEREASIQADKTAIERHAGLSERLLEAEQALAQLGDPRSRDKAIERGLAQRPKLEADLNAQETAAKAHQTALLALDERLRPFEDLDARLEAATGRKVASEPGYRRHLAIAPVAQELVPRMAANSLCKQQLDALEAEVVACELAARERRAAYQPEEHGGLRERVDGLKTETIRLEQAVGFLKQQLVATRREMADLKKVQEEMAEAIAGRDKLAEHAAFVDFARTTLKEAGPFVTQAYLLNISIEADRLFREITGLDHVHLSWSSDYEILLEEDGRPRPFANLSGGEQMAAALAVRLALLKETSSVDVAFFDEPTTNMDESRRANLALQIGEIKTFKQLFVISHDDSFETWTDHVVRVGDRAAV